MASTPQDEFDDLYSCVYNILDDGKATHSLVKLYKGNHGSPQPHPVTLDVGRFFFQQQRGLLAYACQEAGSLEQFDQRDHPRITTREAFRLLVPSLRRDGEPDEAVLRYLVTRIHQLGAYRGGSSGFDEESRAFAAAHFRSQGVMVAPGEVLVFSGGAKGAFMAFCAALMMHRDHDELRLTGGRILAPGGYYQSLRLIPAAFGGSIDVVDALTAVTVRDWLARTAHEDSRCVYVPLVNNADGRVLSRASAREIAGELLAHNAAHPDRPVYVLADDVYAGSYLTTDEGCSLAAVTGADLGEPAWGRMSDWTLSVVTASKTFALPTARVAFAATTSPRLARAVAHYRTVFSYGRVPQADELMAAAAICWTPQTWIDEWNACYRRRLAQLSEQLSCVNAEAGFAAFTLENPQGGWYVPLRMSRRLIPEADSGVDAFAVLLHYGGQEPDSGIGLLPGELFGYRAQPDGFLLRATVAASEPELHLFARRLSDAVHVLTGPDGPAAVKQALARARQVADVDAIVAACRY